VPISDLLLDTVDVQHNPDSTGDRMGGDANAWATVMTAVPVELRELRPIESQALVSSDRDAEMRYFHCRTLTPLDLSKSHRLLWNDAVAGRARYLMVRFPFKYCRHTSQWVGELTEVFK